MVEASRRASRRGPPDALFVVAAAESLPVELHGFADELTIHFPWGSLLRGVLAADPEIVRNLISVTRPGAVTSMLLSVTDRDRGLEPIRADGLKAMAARLADYGLEAIETRRAMAEDVAAAHSSWAKRLGAGARRVAWLVKLIRASPSPPE
jgi:16S rRNA (adenine(1408)-N(1))-methyltransferase